MSSDLALAFHLADLADAITLRSWSPDGVAFNVKADGSPITQADAAAEEAMLSAVRETRPGDGFLGEEVGERLGTTGRRWIVDGIDGTRFFAVGMTEWGSLVALEVDGAIVLGLASSPAQSRRWWPTRGGGAFSRRSGDRSSDTRIHVSTRRQLRPDGVATLPAHDALAPPVQQLVERLAGGPPVARPWHHAIWVAEGRLDVSVWWCGDIWDHAAPSILVEEAGGRFSDHDDGRRLDTRTAVYSNGVCHGDVVAAPGCLLTFTAGSGPVAGSGRHQRNVTGHRHGSEVPQVARLANSAAAASEKNGHSERAPRPVPPGQSVQNSS